MRKNEPIRYSPFRIRECTDADKRFPTQVREADLGYLIVRPAQQLESIPLGQTPIVSEEGTRKEEPKGTN